jgi:hypothetical protein
LATKRSRHTFNQLALFFQPASALPRRKPFKSPPTALPQFNILRSRPATTRKVVLHHHPQVVYHQINGS